MRLKNGTGPVFDDALRYLTNARDLLRKAGRQNGSYHDRKYIRLAGNCAWSGVLVAVDEYLRSKGIAKGRGRMSKEWYISQLSSLSRKLNMAFETAYEGLHLHMGYDGALNAKAADAHLEAGKHVIELCRKG